MTSANQLSNMIAHDPQMQLPQFPFLSPDYLKIWASSDRLIICGAQHDVALRGRSVSKLLPTLLPLLNGRNTIEDICRQIPNMSEQAIRDTLSLLYMRGLLGDSIQTADELPQDERKAFASQAIFYERYVDITRKLKNGYDAIHRLRKSTITLITESNLGIEVILELISLGVGSIQIAGSFTPEEQQYLEQKAHFTAITFVSQEIVETTVDQPDLMIYVTDDADLHQLQILNRIARDLTIPFISALLHPSQIEVGHIYYPESSPCYKCAQVQHALQWTVDDTSTTGLAFYQDVSWITPEQRIGLGRLMLTVSSALTEITTPHNSVVFRFNSTDYEWNEVLIIDIKGCPECGSIKKYSHRDLLVGPQHLENLPVLYHHNTRVKVHEMNPRGHQVHYRDDVIKTVKAARKSYDGVERISLPLSDNDPPTFDQSYVELWRRYDQPATETHAATFRDLSLLLRTAAEVKVVKAGKMVFQKRVTPSGGNLLSQGLYFINLGFEDCEQGVYHFRSDGVLEYLRSGDFQSQIKQASVEGHEIVDTARGILIITNAMGRIESKYGGRAFFFSMLDAGVMLHSLSYIARLLGIEIWQALNFYDDQLNELLGFYTPNEIVSALIYLR